MFVLKGAHLLPVIIQCYRLWQRQKQYHPQMAPQKLLNFVRTALEHRHL